MIFSYTLTQYEISQILSFFFFAATCLFDIRMRESEMRLNREREFIIEYRNVRMLLNEMFMLTIEIITLERYTQRNIEFNGFVQFQFFH